MQQSQSILDKLTQRDSRIDISLLQMTEDYSGLYVELKNFEAENEQLKKNQAHHSHSASPSTGLQSYEEEKNALKQKVADHYTELKKTQDLLEARNSEFQNLTRDYDELLNEDKLLKEQIEAHERNITLQGDILREVRMKLGETVQERDKLLIDKENLQKEVENEKSRADTLTNMIMEVRQEMLDQLNQLNSELDKSQKKINELQEERRKYEILKNKFLEVSNKATSENNFLKVDLKDLQKFQLHTSEINSIINSYNGDMVATCGNDGDVRFYSPSKDLSQWLFKAQSLGEIPTCISFGSDSENFVSGTTEKKVHLWSLSKQKLVHTFTGHTEGITSVLFTKEMSRIVSSSHDKTIKIWDFYYKQVLLETIECDSVCNALAMLNDKNQILTGHQDGSVRIYSLKSKEVVKVYKDIHTTSITSLVLDKDMRICLTASRDNKIKMIDLRMEKVLPVEFKHESYVNSYDYNKVAFYKEGKYVIAGSDDAKVFIWNRETGKLFAILETGNVGMITGCCYNLPSGKAYSVDSSGSVVVWAI